MTLVPYRCKANCTGLDGTPFQVPMLCMVDDSIDQHSMEFRRRILEQTTVTLLIYEAEGQIPGQT